MGKHDDSSDHVHPVVSSRHNTTSQYQYPFAAAPDIIRSNQKDAYFQGVLLTQLSSILRSLYGARFIHTHATSARAFTDLLYLSLTTLIGNRTLGEEYTDVIQISSRDLQLPTFFRRAAYILSSVLLPYSLTQLLPAFRSWIRSKLEASVRRDGKGGVLKNIQSYALTHLSTLTSPSPIYALSLAIFYFSGSYYHVSKRITGLRYIFTKRLAPLDQRVGYEVLGVLLVLQIAVQGWLHLHNTLRSGPPALANPEGLSGGTAVIDGGVEVGLDSQAYGDGSHVLFEVAPSREGSKSRIEQLTHTPVLDDKPRYDLKDLDIMRWIQGKQQRKCTLCLEEMKDPSVTTCGHVFCWTCIGDWIREKPECPLCRQEILYQHVLPLRG